MIIGIVTLNMGWSFASLVHFKHYFIFFDSVCHEFESLWELLFFLPFQKFRLFFGLINYSNLTIINLIQSLSSKVCVFCFVKMELFQNALYQKSYAVGFRWGIRFSYTHFYKIQHFPHTCTVCICNIWRQYLIIKKENWEIQKLKPKIQELPGTLPKALLPVDF